MEMVCTVETEWYSFYRVMEEERKKNLYCLTVKETGNGWPVDPKCGCDGLVIGLVLYAAL